MPVNRMWIALQRAILICLVRWIVAAMERCSLAAIERVVRTLGAHVCLAHLARAETAHHGFTSRRIVPSWAMWVRDLRSNSNEAPNQL